MSMYPRPDWPEALATVTECHYDAGAGRAMAFGLPTGKHFRITYNYWAPNTDGKEELHTGEFSSPFAMPQGRLFAVNYNPAAPRQHKSLNPKLPSYPEISTIFPQRSTTAITSSSPLLFPFDSFPTTRLALAPDFV